jgi:Arylsulfotransferase (ASST)
MNKELHVNPEDSRISRVGRSRQSDANSRPMLVLTLLALQALVAADATAGSKSAPPPVTILTPATGLGNGYIFVMPTGGKYPNGPEILDVPGNIVWFQPIPNNQVSSDFRTQRYYGNPVLTWWQGTGFGGLSCGTDYIYDNHFNPIATVQAGNGYCADGHEFLISPRNTALITVFAETTADLTAVGGPPNQTVIDGIVQEIDIPTGAVLFQWNSADHVPSARQAEPTVGLVPHQRRPRGH